MSRASRSSQPALRDGRRRVPPNAKSCAGVRRSPRRTARGIRGGMLRPDQPQFARLLEHGARSRLRTPLCSASVVNTATACYTTRDRVIHRNGAGACAGLSGASCAGVEPPIRRSSRRREEPAAVASRLDADGASAPRSSPSRPPELAGFCWAISTARPQAHATVTWRRRAPAAHRTTASMTHLMGSWPAGDADARSRRLRRKPVLRSQPAHMSAPRVAPPPAASQARESPASEAFGAAHLTNPIPYRTAR